MSTQNIWPQIRPAPNKDSMADNLSLKQLSLEKLMEIVKNVLLAIAATDTCLPETTQNIFYSFTISLGGKYYDLMLMILMAMQSSYSSL